MTIYIGGDIVPTPSNEQLFMEGRAENLIGSKIFHFFEESACNVLNLEVPISDISLPIPKSGPNLAAKADTVNGLKNMNITAVGLANNHVLDQGESAFLDMIDILRKNDISYFGGGCNLDKAKAPFVFTDSGKKVGFYACAEHEFTIADADKAGANPYDPLESFDDIVKLKKVCDYVIVLYHGGKEYYQYPSPQVQKICRKMVDKGADLVITQHSHCIGCRENYRGKAIVYGQGNFLFDQESRGEKFPDISKTGLLLRVEIEEQMTVTELPLCLTMNGQIELASQDVGKKIIDEYQARGEQIKIPGFVEDNYEKFSLEMIRSYLRIGLGRGILIRLINGLCGRKLVEYALKKKDLLSIQNNLQCEAHREIFLRGIKSYIGKYYG